MGDPVGAHITRIYVNCPRSSPSPIRSSNTAPVCTSTPIAPGLSNNPSPQQKMAQIAKEAAASQRGSETFIRKAQTPPLDNFLFVSKESGQAIDFNTGDGLGKLNPPNVPTLPKKKKKRHTLAVVPPAISAPCTKKNIIRKFDNLWGFFLLI